MPKPIVVIDALAFDPRDGGFASTLMDVLRSCTEIDDFKFIVIHHSSHSDYFNKMRMRNHSVSFPYKLRFFASLLYTRKIVKELRADLVHFELSAVPWGLDPPATATVTDLHFLIDPKFGKRTLTGTAMTFYWRRLFAPALSRATVIKAISKTTASDIYELTGIKTPVRVIYPRFEPPAGGNHEHLWAENEQPLKLLFIGSVIPRKNLGFLLDALPLIQRPWELDIVGNAWWGSDVLEQVSQDPRVRIHGYVTDAERDRLIASANFLVAPSVYEGFGYPVAESMIAGLPVLTSDIPVFREFVPEGLLFRLDSPKHLAVLVNSMTKEEYYDAAKRCLASVKRFSPHSHIAGHRCLFEEALGRQDHDNSRNG